jgi:hypothetical protein
MRGEEQKGENGSEEKKKGKRRETGEVVTICVGRGQENMFPVSKVPRQCLLVLPLEVVRNVTCYCRAVQKHGNLDRVGRLPDLPDAN